MILFDNTFTRRVVTISSRVTSMGLTFAMFSMCVRNMSIRDFSSLMVLTAFIGLLIWILDFGSMTRIMILRSANRIQDSRKLMGTRNLVLISTIILGSLFLFVFGSELNILLINAVFFDLFTDSFVGYRQIHENIRSFVWKMNGKRFFQITLLYFCIQFTEIEILSAFSISVLIPSICVFSFDLRMMRPILDKTNILFYFSSPGFWFQSGGTSLAMLDTVVLSRFGGTDFIPILVLGKRISNAVGILGANLVPETLHAWSKSIELRSKSWKQIFTFSFIGGLIAILIFLFKEPLVTLILDRYLTDEENFVLNCVLLSIPIGIMTSNFNAILLSLNRLSRASTSTYLSTLTYLAILIFGMNQENVQYFIGAAILLNLLMEILLQSFLFFRLTWKDQIVHET